VQFFRSPMLVAAAPGSSLPPDVARRALTVRAAAGSDDAADSALWMRRARTWIVAQPGAFAALQLRKARWLLQAGEGAQIESWSFQRQRIGLLRLFIVDFGWIWPLAVLGTWHAWRQRRRGTWIVAGFALALLLPCLVFFVSARYRLAAVPPLAVLGGSGAAALIDWIRVRRVRQAAIASAAVLGLVLLSRIGADNGTSGFGWEHVQMADRLYALGDLDGAIASQTAAAQLMSDRPEVPMQLALYWSERNAPGDADRALALLRETASRHPDRAAVWFNLGVVLVRQGHGEEARQAWQRALTADPSFEPARARLRAAEGR
jgi:cytochrome c-type biogenesis protein CcmH/NrfG